MAYNFSSAPQTEDAPKVESEEFTGRQPLFKADRSAVCESSAHIYLRIQRKSSQRKEEDIRTLQSFAFVDNFREFSGLLL